MDEPNVVYEDDPRSFEEIVMLGCDCHPGREWHWCMGWHNLDDMHEPFYYMEDEN